MKTLLKSAFFITLFVLISACSSGTTTSGTPPNLSGATFSGTLQASTFNVRSIQLTLIQDDADAITGTFLISNFTGCLDGGSVAGTISGTSLSLTITDNSGATLDFTGSASDNSIDGNFTVSGADATTCLASGNFSGSLNVTR